MKLFGKITLSIAIVFVMCLLSGAIVMWLWNWIIPIIFDKAVEAGWIAGSITYWQGWGLSFLGSCLFGKSSSYETDRY